MLTYASTAPRVQTLLRRPRPHLSVRCLNRRSPSGSSLSSLRSSSPGIVPVASSSSSCPFPGALRVAPASSSSSSSSLSFSASPSSSYARLHISQHDRIHRIDGPSPAGTGTWALNKKRPLRVVAADASRCLSSTTRRPVEDDRGGRERRESTTTNNTSSQTQTQPPRPGAPPPPPQQQQPQDQQPPKKGIRKALLPSSLTPHENIYTVPNLLTFSRLAAAPFVGWAILHDAHALALALFAYAGVSDLLDGWIARRWKLQTVVGSVVDPMADKTLMTVLTVCLAMKGGLPVWLAAIILGRDAGLGVAAIYYRWISLPPPKTLARYWDFSLPSAEVRPTTISKYNTFLQLGLMGATMVAPVVAADVGGAMTAFQYLVATTTVWSGLSYVFTKDAVRILSEGREKQEQKQKEQQVEEQGQKKPKDP
ncbi:CDP-alcohol phosphatidyltransferase-domain-containing protein [Nemania sp. NC0429]|nr:CDP-alcohol phosphatidyltransferase-domain-containing protein [Nemania sp. NC0429]